jgi:hypothetical protein
MTDVVITAAKRTPVGAFLGAFASTPAHELGRVAIEAALDQAGVAPEEVSEVILGQVLTAAQGQNPARQASMVDHDRGRQGRRRRRPGEHEPFNPCPECPRRHQDG